MKIYTKAGDAGDTGLFGGARVSKANPRIEAYGTLDELNAVLGMALADNKVPFELASTLTRIQNELFQLGSELATPVERRAPAELVAEAHIVALEREIDLMEATLPALRNFILPGGAGSTTGAALLHFARTVCRRAEREVVVLNSNEKMRGEVLKYLNRLSDFLFVSSRFVNHKAGVADVEWKKP
jgi:cob(I)alamin adenosyltransferase